MDQPLLIATADVHLSENPPSARSTEPDWFAAQARQLRWLKALAAELHCPVVVAGDIFDKSMGTTRLVNFVADEFPFSYAIAGNHDLPYHNLDRVSISSYGSLIRSKRIVDIGNGVIRISSHGTSIALHGFPYGVPPKACEKQADIDVAVVHQFVWNGTSNLLNILYDSHIKMVKPRFPGYDFYVFGDNHGPFIEGNFVNCGAFYRRVKADKDYQPAVALIYRDRIEFSPIPVEDDVFSVSKSVPKETTSYDFTGFLDSLRQAESLTCDADMLLQGYLHSHQVEPDVNEAIISITES